MQPNQYLIILFFSAFTGWFISWISIRLIFWPVIPVKLGIVTIQGLVPARQKYLAENIGNKVQTAFQAYRGFDEKISDPALIEKLKPEIEIHIDHFLKEKLKSVFPILAQFMGEKTLNQFKQAFLTEIDNLLPVMIKNYMNGLKNEIRLDSIISEKINALELSTLKKAFYANTGKETRYFKMACTFVGFITGVLTILILLMIN